MDYWLNLFSFKIYCFCCWLWYIKNEYVFFYQFISLNVSEIFVLSNFKLICFECDSYFGVSNSINRYSFLTFINFGRWKIEIYWTPVESIFTFFIFDFEHNIEWRNFAIRIASKFSWAEQTGLSQCSNCHRISFIQSCWASTQKQRADGNCVYNNFLFVFSFMILWKDSQIGL